MRAVFHGVPKEKKKRKIQFRRISIVSVFIEAHMFALAVLFLVAKSRKLRVPPRILRMTEVNLRIKAYSCHIIRTTRHDSFHRREPHYLPSYEGGEAIVVRSGHGDQDRCRRKAFR